MMALISITPKQLRIGSFQGIWKAPDNLKGIIKIITDADLSDIRDSTKTLSMNIYSSVDNVTYQHEFGTTYLGGNYLGAKENNIGLIFDTKWIAGKWVRVVIEINKTWNVGINITTE
jgi:hypothetical protein